MSSLGLSVSSMLMPNCSSLSASFSSSYFGSSDWPQHAVTGENKKLKIMSDRLTSPLVLIKRSVSLVNGMMIIPAEALEIRSKRVVVTLVVK
jgi:hypothetical protein